MKKSKSGRSNSPKGIITRRQAAANVFAWMDSKPQPGRASGRRKTQPKRGGGR